MAAPAKLLAAVERFREACARDERVLAAFLGGSLAADRADAHSDLDLYAIARPELAGELARDARAFVASFGDPVFVGVTANFEGLGFDMLHFVLADGVSGEVAIGSPAAVRRLHGGAHRVLVDEAGILAGVEFALVQPSPDERRAEVERALAWFWLHAIGLAKALARGQAWTAHAQLERMRRCAWTLLAAAELPPEQAAAQERALAASVVPLERAGLARAARTLLETYGALAPLAASRSAVDVPAGLARVAAAKLEPALTPAPR